MSSDDSEREDYEPWSDDDEQHQAPARPAAPEALDADTLAALNSLDGETLAGQLWDVLGGLAVNCARGDATAQTVAARARAALTPREYAMALQPELTRCGEQATWCWLVDELHACLERVTMERASSVAPRAGSAVWRTACLAVSQRQKAARKALDSDLVVEEDDDGGGLEVDADVAAAKVFGVATTLSQKCCETCRCVAVRLALKLAAWDALPDDYASQLWRLIRSCGVEPHRLLSVASQHRPRRLARARRRRKRFEKEKAAHKERCLGLGARPEELPTKESTGHASSSSSGDSASSDSGRWDSSSQDSECEGRRLVRKDRHASALGAKPDPDLRWSLTGIARLVARENGFAGPLARTHEWRLVAPLAARLLSRHAQSEAGAAAAGAQLLRSLVEANPLKMDRDEILERRCARRLARVAARAADPRARRAARPALAGLLATVFDDGRRTSLLSACFKKGDACGAVLDCLGRELVANPRGIDDLVATALRDRFASMDKDADAGYDALVLNLDAHVAVAALARRVALAGPGKLPASVAALRDDAAPRRVAELLRSRLRRAVAAPNVGRETVPATTGSADEPAKPGGEPAAQRFMLHLLAENLDYVLEALGPVS
jgi:hypothetical protein